MEILKRWAWLIVAILMLLGLQIASHLHPAVAEALEWSRTDMASGQWWRLLTGHWVHLGFTHLSLNLGGLVLLALLFERSAPIEWTLGYLFAAPIAISLGLLWAIPQLEWYRGFSGSLHGLFVLLALAGFRHHPQWHGFLVAGLAIKLVFEALYPSGTAELIGAAVIYPAHWLGSLTGLIAGLLLLFSRRNQLREGPAPPSPE